MYSNILVPVLFDDDARIQQALDVARTLAAFTDVIPSSDFADGASATDRFVLRIGTSAAAEAAITEVALTAIAPNPSTGSARCSASPVSATSCARSR